MLTISLIVLHDAVLLPIVEKRQESNDTEDYYERITVLTRSDCFIRDTRVATAVYFVDWLAGKFRRRFNIGQ